MNPVDLTFRSGGVICHAWHFAAQGPAGRPVIVMAHGFGGTRDSGLEPFAQRFAAAGYDVLAFDFRGFGTSEGQPRQSISVTRQIEDYRSAIAAAKALPGVDPHRVVLWGASMSGGHVFSVAADRTDIAAVIALTPLTSGLAAARAAAAQGKPGPMLKNLVSGVRSRLAHTRGHRPVLVPLVAEPGQVGTLTLDGARDSYLAIAGPSWRNEIDASVGFEFARIRSTADARRVRCPVLVQIADFDRYVPAQSAATTASAARAVVHHYPCDHFDVWPGQDWYARAVDDQVAFLARTLG